MPPLKIAVALGLVFAWPALAAAQYEPPDARYGLFLERPGGIDALQTGGGIPLHDPPTLDWAAARLNDVVARQVPSNPIRTPAAGTPLSSASSIPSPTSSPIPSQPRTGGGLPISPSHHVRLGEPGSRPGGPTSLLTVGSSLAVVLGLFLLVAWGIKRAMPNRSGVLPSEVVEVLGRASLGARQQVHLVRCGSKLLLVSATPGGMETLTEIAEPDEVQRLAALCRQTQPGSTTAAFRQVFQQLAAGADHDA
jgi:flagellar biogenesis protein FliO